MIDTTWSYFETGLSAQVLKRLVSVNLFLARMPKGVEGANPSGSVYPLGVGHTFKLMVTNNPIRERKAFVFQQKNRSLANGLSC